MIDAAIGSSVRIHEKIKGLMPEMLCILFALFFPFGLLVLATLISFVAYLRSFARRNVSNFAGSSSLKF